MTIEDLINNKDGEINTFPNQMPGKVMRLSMENKNLLATKGSMYVGTGNSQETTAAGVDYTVAQTTVINPPSAPGGGADTPVLSYTGNGETGGVEWMPLSSLGIKGKIINVSATENNPNGTWSSTSPYQYTINSTNHGLGETSNIFVQLMMGDDNTSYEIVGATVSIDKNGTIKIQSNIKWSGKVLLFVIS